MIAAPKPERIQLHMLSDGIATKRVIAVTPGVPSFIYEGVTYQRTDEKAGLHGHGNMADAYIAVFKPKESP